MKNMIKNWFRQGVESICVKLERSILSNKSLKCKIVFGPVRSRRLGYVLGVNNIKEKACPYDCIYCPAGKTSCCSVCSNYCLSPYELHIAVRKKLEEIKRSGRKIEYIVFAGSGEPTLDTGLSKEILLLREFGYKIAVFTNGAMLWNDNVKENLMAADYVSVKIDTVNESTWLRMNRPHKRLDYSIILEGIKDFSKKFRGTFTTETTLIKDFNDSAEEIDSLSKYFKKLRGDRFYFSVPIYPTAENFAVSPDNDTLLKLTEILREKIPGSEMLCCPEKEEFIATDDFENELLGLMALHPIDSEAVKNFVNSEGGVQRLNDMINKGLIREMDYNGKKFLTENLIAG